MKIPRSSSEAQKLADPSYGPVPGRSPLYSTYRGKEPLFPGNITDPILPTRRGEPGVDDMVWQNLLSAEWAIFSFYQQGVEAFDKTSFAKAGYPNTTYDRIQEIRDNEAESFLVLSTFIEIASMAFLTGLVQIAKLPASQVFPYANQILDLTNGFVIKGSCPNENPVYPNPRQGLPSLNDRQYYTTFFYGTWNTTIPIDTKDWPKKKIIDVKIPESFESRGIIIAVVTDTIGAPTKDTVLASPAIILPQPAELAVEVAQII
ncbi:uncharacterized protein BKA55DRAFT_666871 [Fusarium redolens]|uniref:Uncharacterized protein n=1 Tax=Fusarium redolens TaxID=48865 RepID=A0A9P9G8S9_FUSRE|nr:uncharacterized protein BKA55DRAFT_666871 [Fusarium redolens]KAH7234646.1 hypothetical protein BKA55DRAFT_666871 [Fusarium redolens]